MTLRIDPGKLIEAICKSNLAGQLGIVAGRDTIRCGAGYGDPGHCSGAMLAWRSKSNNLLEPDAEDRSRGSVGRTLQREPRETVGYCQSYEQPSGGREYCPFQGASRVEQTLRKAISRALAILMPRIAAGDVWEADCNLDRAERSNLDGDIDIRNAEGRAPIEIRFFYVNY